MGLASSTCYLALALIVPSFGVMYPDESRGGPL